MSLYNKLIRIDLLLVVVIVALVCVRQGFWLGFFQGMGAALLVLSVVNHITHYKLTKKFY